MQAQKKELDHIRQNYRKNSLYRSSSSAGSIKKKPTVLSDIGAVSGSSNICGDTAVATGVGAADIDPLDGPILEEEPPTPTSDSPKVQRIKVFARDTDTD